MLHIGYMLMSLSPFDAPHKLFLQHFLCPCMAVDTVYALLWARGLCHIKYTPSTGACQVFGMPLT